MSGVWEVHNASLSTSGAKPAVRPAAPGRFYCCLQRVLRIERSSKCCLHHALLDRCVACGHRLRAGVACLFVWACRPATLFAGLDLQKVEALR